MTIGKRTFKLTKEARAKKIYKDLTDEQKEALYLLVGKIGCGEIKNFYSTRIYKNLVKELSFNQKVIVTYICRKVALVKIFENMDDVILNEGQ